MVQINFDSSFPDPLRKEFESLVNEYKFLMPPWLKRLTFHFSSVEDQNTVLEMIAQEEYRIASMIVYPAFLVITDKEMQKLCFMHELIHNFYDRLRSTAYNLANLLQDDAAKKLANEQIRAADESGTQDMANAIMEVINEGKGSRKK